MPLIDRVTFKRVQGAIISLIAKLNRRLELVCIKFLTGFWESAVMPRHIPGSNTNTNN